MRQALRKKKVPEEALDLVISALAPATAKQYSSALKYWWTYCQTNNENFFKPKRETLLKCIKQKFDEGASYGTVNILRSTVSYISKKKIGQDDIICMGVKGCFKQRPPKPKYNFTWDIGIVLDFLKTLYPLETLNIKQLSEKTAALLVFSIGYRVQTLSLIRLQNIRRTTQKLEIKITDIIKTSAPDKCQPLLIIEKFEDNPEICVYTTLLKYIEVTSTHRNGEDLLFLSSRPPYKAVGAQTISKWIKKTMEQSGIDIDIFTTHSTRHATSSAAFSKGINIETIKNTIGWSERSNVFAKFYNRPIVSEVSSFAKTVMLNRKKK